MPSSDGSQETIRLDGPRYRASGGSQSTRSFYNDPNIQRFEALRAERKAAARAGRKTYGPGTEVPRASRQRASGYGYPEPSANEVPRRRHGEGRSRPTRDSYHDRDPSPQPSVIYPEDAADNASLYLPSDRGELDELESIPCDSASSIQYGWRKPETYARDRSRAQNMPQQERARRSHTNRYSESKPPSREWQAHRSESKRCDGEIRGRQRQRTWQNTTIRPQPTRGSPPPRGSSEISAATATSSEYRRDWTAQAAARDNPQNPFSPQYYGAGTQGDYLPGSVPQFSAPTQAPTQVFGQPQQPMTGVPQSTTTSYLPATGGPQQAASPYGQFPSATTYGQPPSATPSPYGQQPWTSAQMPYRPAGPPSGGMQQRAPSVTSHRTTASTPGANQMALVRRPTQAAPMRPAQSLQRAVTYRPEWQASQGQLSATAQDGQSDDGDSDDPAATDEAVASRTRYRLPGLREMIATTYGEQQFSSVLQFTCKKGYFGDSEADFNKQFGGRNPFNVGMTHSGTVQDHEEASLSLANLGDEVLQWGRNGLKKRVSTWEYRDKVSSIVNTRTSDADKVDRLRRLNFKIDD